MRYLITGGAGFIGCNYADRLLARGETVVALDNLSRPRVAANVAWLRERHCGTSFALLEGDVRDPGVIERAVRGADVVVHLAGQTAVTTSIADPRADFEINAAGTLNVLEAARRIAPSPIVLFASTNKVYGDLRDVPVVEHETRHAFRDLPYGIDETRRLEFLSPYGCSKGTGDQYVRDYARIFGLRTVVLRQSCIYGPRQMGIEDQGWLAWFLIAAALRRPLAVYGDGKQVRDVLHVEDLLDAYDAAVARIDTVAGEVFNVGGGPERAISVWVELAALIERLVGTLPEVRRLPWRPGDQRVYVSDVRKAARDLDWRPRIAVEDGIRALHRWVEEHRALFADAG